MEGWSFLHFGHCSKDREKSNQKCFQDPPKSFQTEPNKAILALKWPILSATCCQLDSSCVHLGPIFAPTSRKISTERARNLKKRPQTPQDHPGWRQRAPGQPLKPDFCMVSGSILDLIFNFFCSLSFNFLSTSFSISHLFYNQISDPTY